MSEPTPVPAAPPPAEEEAGLSRRRFLTYLVGVAGALGLAGLAAPIIRYAYPVTTAEIQPKQEVGTLSALTPLGEAVYFDYLEAPAALILLEDGTPYACYLACTHFGCIVQWRPEDRDWYCPCHAGVFAPDGEVVAGPPPSPLVALNVVAEGDLLYVEGTAETEEG